MTTDRHPLEATGEEVARLTRPEREWRVNALVERSHEIMQEAITVELGGREIAATAVLFSGGNDSTTLVHLFREQATHAIHANTGIGVEATRQFVRDTCAGWSIPLLEKHPPVSYRELVLAHGFPGPGQHFKMYQRLKERCLDAARVDLGVHRSRKLRALYVAGRRREESARRSDIPLYEPDGSVIWVSPLAEWTKLDLNTYRLMNRDVPRNPVADALHMSGECLCGSFAKAGELEEVGDWHPEVREEIEALEAEIADREDIPLERRKWGWGAYRGRIRPSRRTGRLCSSCVAPTEIISTTTAAAA